MDVFRMLMGICFILVSIIILITIIQDEPYTKKDFHIGNVKMYSAGIMSLLFGIYFFITSF